MVDDLDQDRCQIDDGLHCFGRIVVDRGDLGTAAAGCGALLPEPATFLADFARGKLVHHCRHHFHDARGEAAIGAIKVRTEMRLARRGQAEDLGRMKRSGHRQDIGRCRDRLFEIGDFGTAGSLLDDPDHAGARYFGLGTGAE
jgi:hypothetical protein